MPEIGGGLARIQAQLAAFAARGVAVTSVVKAISREALTQSQQCFRESRNPYGEPWAKLKHRSGKPLLLTGRGRGSLALSDVSATGFRVGTNVGYMHVHQDGVDKTYARKASARTQAVGKNGRFLSRAKAGKTTRKSAVGFRRLNYRGGDVHLVIPQRAFLPIRGRGLGLWEVPLERAALLALQRLSR